MQQQHQQSPHPGGQMMMHAPMLLQNSRQAMPPGPHQMGRHQQMQQQIQPHLGHHPQQQQQQPQQQPQQHLNYHQIHHHQASPHSHGSPVSHSSSPHPQPQIHHQQQLHPHTQHHLNPQQHHQSIGGQHQQIPMHPQSPHSHNGPTLHIQQQQQQPQQLHHPQQINQMGRSSLGPSPVMNHQRSSLQQPSHHHQQSQFYSSGAIKHSSAHQYNQQNQHQHHPQHILPQQNHQSHPQIHHPQQHHQQQHHQLQQQHQQQHQQHQQQPQSQSQQHHHQIPQPQPSPQLIHHHTPSPVTHHLQPQSTIGRLSPSPTIRQTEFRIIELNRWLQSRPITRHPISPQPNNYLFDESKWWEKFAFEFFEDDATLTLRIQDEKPIEYTISRTLIPKFFRTYFEGGVTDLSFNLRNPKESHVHPHSQSLITLDCDQTIIVSIFRHPSMSANPGVVVHTEGHLILDFVCNSYDTLSIKSWKFYTKCCREYVDRSMTAMGANIYLGEPITRQGLTKSTISYLKMCMIMQPMQEIMLQHRQTEMDPRSCLRKYLYDRFKYTSPTDNRAGIKTKRKRKSAASSNTGPALQTTTKRTKANLSTTIGNNGLNNNLNMSSPGIPSFSLASQDVMVVGEPSIMGSDFGDDNERMTTRLENTQYDPTVCTPNVEESDNTTASVVNQNIRSNGTNIDKNVENHTSSPSLQQQQQQQQHHEATVSAPQSQVPSQQNQLDQTSPRLIESQQQQHVQQNAQHIVMNIQDQPHEATVAADRMNQVNLLDHSDIHNNEADQKLLLQSTTEPQATKNSEQQVNLENCSNGEVSKHHQSESANERESTRDSFKSVDIKGEESTEVQITERKNGESKPKESPNEGSNESTVSTKISSKQNRRRSSERKETLREGLMRTSDFVVAMKDLKSEHPALWRITTGNNLLQQFEPKTQKGMILYENTNQYAGWNPEIKKDYVGVDVKLTQQNRNQIFVERLFLNFQKIEDADAFYDKHFVIYLQIIISTALDPKFWESIESDPKHHDYFITSRRIIEDIIKRHKVKISSKMKLSEVVLKQIEKYPNVVVSPHSKDSKEQLCRACNTNPSTQNLSFANRSYDLHTYRLVQVTGESIDDSELNHNLCDSCLDLVKLYSSAHHMGWKLFNLARERVGRPQTKDKPINAILDECLKDENWLTLVGLCFSRAAAMVINFNLLLVWVPMCKYSLTWVAYLANSSLRIQELKQQRLRSSLESNQHQLVKQEVANDGMLRQLLRKLKFSIEAATSRCQLLLCWAKINSTNSFLLAVDHCRSLHTICATTITIASVIHTVAHLMNVINFSRNYDPILSDLNMAEYKGQNPLQLLISIPGITGILMLLILILMSLSSLDFIRALSFDLFQIFHRLSIIFVILLVLHPASHVLKEQSNVERHHPDLCHNNSLMVGMRLVEPNLLLNSSLSTMEANPLSSIERNDAPSLSQPVGLAHNASELQAISANAQQRTLAMATATAATAPANKSASYSVNNKEPDLKISLFSRHTNEDPEEDGDVDTNDDDDGDDSTNDNDSQPRTTAAATRSRQHRLFKRQESDNENYGFRPTVGEEDPRPSDDQLAGSRWTTTVAVNSSSFYQQQQQEQQCSDPLPLFVAQNSICWYALSAGLSCYLLDLILRKRRRSKSSIQLLDVRADREGNLIELIFNNNHKRFTHWLPGQFVYLNCPQVANFEWHPFTISSMDNANRLFTLHIKTGGDWTRKLRARLGLLSLDGNCDSVCSADSMSTISAPPTFRAIGQDAKIDDCNITISSDFLQHETPILPDFVPRNHSGKPLVECTKLIRISYDSDQPPSYHEACADESKTTEGSLYSISRELSCSESAYSGLNVGPLDLYVDGPFHSPFERLLEQPVSIGIANGVGWTAFSSAFQCVTNELAIETNKFSKNWWKRQHQLYLDPSISTGCQFVGGHTTRNKLRNTKLHLMVTVTSIEQLRPFYRLALNYFDRMNECKGSGNTSNPVKEITAFITRSSTDDKTVTDFCARENIPLADNGRFIRVNTTFKIHFGRPDFEKFLSSFRATYADERKISVYCCGSNQVKKIVRELCRDLNKTVHRTDRFSQLNPLYSYHEESF